MAAKDRNTREKATIAAIDMEHADSAVLAE